MEILETGLADDGTILHGIAASTRGRRYRWFNWADGVAIACASRSARSSGVAGNLAAQAVIGSQPDGYRLLVVTTVGAINATLYPRLSFNFLRDVAPVARLVRMVNLVVMHPSVPANTLAEFIAPVIEKSGIKGSL